MAMATDGEILAAAHALREARCAHNAAYDAKISAQGEAARRRAVAHTAREAVAEAQREFDRMLELRDDPIEEA